MADVATLGLSVDSSDVSKGAVELDKLSNAAKRAQAAATGVSASTKNASTAAVSMAGATSSAAASLDKEAVAAKRAAEAMRLHAVAANSNVKAAGNLNTANIAAQFQDIAVSAQMGMGALQIGLQQGTQLAAVVASMENPVKGLGEAFLSVISPVSLLVIGLTALAAAGLQMIDWGRVGAMVLTTLADVLVPIAPYAVAAAVGLALLYAPAMISGVVQLIALMARLAVSTLAVAAAFAAANPAVAFVLGITAAVAAANIFRDELTQIFGFDIVAAAADGVNKIIGTFVGAYEGVKATWSQLPSAIGDLVFQAVNSVIAGVETMLNKVGAYVDAFIEKINGAMSSLPFGMGEGISINPVGTFNLPDVANPFKGAASGVASTIGGKMSEAQGVNYVGAMGGAITNMASSAAEKLRGLATSFGGVGDAAGGAGKAARDAAEGATDPWMGLRGAVDTVSEGMRFARDIAGGFFSDLRSGLESGKGFFQSFASAAMNALDKVIDKIMNQLLDAIFQVNSAGGGGGILGSLLGGLFGGGFNPTAGGFADMIGYANGTTSARAGIAMVGERGPELVRFRGGEQVVPNHKIGAANQNSPSVNFAPAFNIDARGAQQGVGAEIEEAVKKAIVQMKKDMPLDVAKALKTIKIMGYNQ